MLSGFDGAPLYLTEGLVEMNLPNSLFLSSLLMSCRQTMLQGGGRGLNVLGEWMFCVFGGDQMQQQS